MIDIHSHILPLVDDGASSVEMALEMLSKAYLDGTDLVFLTPHFARPYGFYNPNEKIKRLFNDLSDIVKKEGIPIELRLGCEYLYSSKEDFFEDLPAITCLNQTSYLLIEFFFDEREETMIEAVQTITDAGMIPIIAHPERFETIQESFSLIRSLRQMGALFQMNKGSILGRYGRIARETALDMLKGHYYSFVGSDAHHPMRRSSLMFDAYQEVERYFGKTYAKEIFSENPKRLIENIDIRVA